ncbi:Na+/H+ antiporter NhaA [Nocardioides jiangxiensis]|uniref:Na(+)/H(+) antiporter NhaA n=1 Tax=Nocardioides jiangxiensis TaxID=3064524 RepID=A0ABT9B0R1_9ACTN|nr:Na+/H+ antiporter NhaA [Nocardioides sp. WY-20]MDO7868446.1 Na+/H+ antiporter NhaA [Nocardioides sp. WY-20]
MRPMIRLRYLPDLTATDRSSVGDFLRQETVGGALALIAAVVAVAWANTPWSASYADLRHVQAGPLTLEQWAADGALTIFFFVAGLELKREFVVGSLSRITDAVVPVVAAVCGVAVPALIYTAVNLAHPDGRPGGWAIPSATDIAFALAVLAVVGSALPPQLRAFLLTLAVVDDLIVIVIIATFYSSSLHLVPLAVAGAGMVVWWLLQHFRIQLWLVHIAVAVVTWWFMHESGVHATIAGVALGLLTRVRRDPGEAVSPAAFLEHQLHPVSAAFAVPVFAFMSAGVAVSGGASLTADPVVIGIVLGLVLGKPVGVFGGSWLLCRLTRADIDDDVRWRDVAAVAVLAGVGFTVSLLVSELSFSGAEREAAKTAVLVASTVAALLASVLLGLRSRAHRASAPTA